MNLIERALRDLVAAEVRRVVREERAALSPRLRLAIKSVRRRGIVRRHPREYAVDEGEKPP
jgi:hypothetical protein